VSTAPEWVAQLDFSKEWDLKPWEFFGGSKLLWWFRWKARRDEAIKANNK
jgi:hypothetical protein